MIPPEKTAQEVVYEATRAAWVQQVRDDPELNLNLWLAKMATEVFVDPKNRPAFLDMLNITGCGDHPEFIRMMLRIMERVLHRHTLPGLPLSVVKAKPGPKRKRKPKRRRS